MVICFTKYLLGEKHHLSKIWLAAHWEKKIKRTQIFELDIEKSVQDIMDAEIILDLRISGHLLVGIVKIHSRKAKYLLTECNSVFYQVKIFRSGKIDLPDNKQTAAVNDITLAEMFNDNFDNAGNDIIDIISTANQCQIEEITLKETSERLILLDDDMMNFAFQEEDEPLEFPDENMLSLYNDIEIVKDLTVKKNFKPNQGNTIYNQPEDQNLSVVEEVLDELHATTSKDEFAVENLNSENLIAENAESIDMPHVMNEDMDYSQSDNFGIYNVPLNNRPTDKLELETLQNFSDKVTKYKKIRKRKLHIDYIKCLSQNIIKKQVLDTSNIIAPFDIAPCSKRLMYLKETGCAEKLFSLPAMKLQNPKLQRIYQRNLKTCSCDNFELPAEDEHATENVHLMRKASQSESISICMTTQNLSENFDEAPVSDVSDIKSNLNVDNGISIPYDDFITEAMDECLERQACDTLLPENSVANNFQISDVNDVQSTPECRTSQEKWEYALQGRIVQMLLCLKQLFTENHIVQFSNLTENNKKLWVAQKFLCLLMLKKFQVIALEQSESYSDVFISQDINFESACIKLCSS